MIEMLLQYSIKEFNIWYIMCWIFYLIFLICALLCYRSFIAEMKFYVKKLNQSK